MLLNIAARNKMGLLLRVQPSGARTFYVQIGRGQRVRIGPAGTFTPKQASTIAEMRTRKKQRVSFPVPLPSAHTNLTLPAYIEPVAN